MSKTWFNIDAKSGTPTLYIYDEIGAFGITLKDFATAFRALGDMKGKKLHVRINSPGGNVFMGNGIYNLLVESGADITFYIDGLAASMASLIAMAPGKVIIAANAVMMIHNPAAGVGGEAKDMTRMATLLETLKDGMVTAYANKSGLSRDAIAKIMDETTWLSAEEAVEAGFADEIGGELRVAAFDLTRFKNPPTSAATTEGVLDMDKTELAALMAENNKTLVTGITAAIADALKPKAAEPDANAAKPKTEAEIRAEVVAEQKARTEEVTSLCVLAGFPEAAAEHIASGKTIAEIRAALVAKQAEGKTRDNGGGINNHLGAPEGKTRDKDEDISDLIPKAEASSVVWDRFNGKDKRAA